MLREALTVAQIKDRAPSVFAKHASSKMSESYAFVPSTLVLEALEKINMLPVQASQRKSKQDGDVARHLVRFAFKEDIGRAKQKGEVIPEVVMVNSHNGRTAFKLYYGLFRLICGNGLVIPETTVGMTRRHIGDIKAIIAEVDAILDQGPTVTKLVKAMKAQGLTDAQRHTLAKQALDLRYIDKHETGKPTQKPTIIAEQLLVPRRPTDNGKDLWTTFNVIQENLVVGGITGKSANGRATHTRQLQDVRKLVGVNTGLWDLANQLLKKAA